MLLGYFIKCISSKLRCELNKHPRIKSSLKNILRQFRPRGSKNTKVDQLNKDIFSVSSFYELVLKSVLSESQNNYLNNFDSYRFKSENSVRNSFNLEKHLYFFKYFVNNADKFEQGYEALNDNASKALYIKLIAYKILGHKCVQVLKDPKAYWKIRNHAESLPAEKAKIKLVGGFSAFKRYHFDFNNRQITLEAQHANVSMTFFIKQYYYDRAGIKIQPEEGDYAVDGGACYGDTAIAFASSVGAKGKVYSFDFIPSHINAMQNNIDLNPWAKEIIKIFPYAVGKISNKVNGLANNDDKEMISGASLLWTAGISEANVPIRSIDDLHLRGEIERVDFIKLDIEGFEIEALLGARKSIEKFTPKLAISLYHKDDDFFKIPETILKINPGYRFYLDHYTSHAEETILYAIDEINI